MASRLSSAYLEAINDSRFVKGFGITALVSALLLFAGIGLLASGVGLGVGMFILGYGGTRFYRVVGIMMMVTGILFPVAFLSPMILSGSVFWKGLQTLNILTKEGRDDEDWGQTRKRALTGTVASGTGVFLSLVFLALMVVGLLLRGIQ